jgi:hypothetical protein
VIKNEGELDEEACGQKLHYLDTNAGKDTVGKQNQQEMTSQSDNPQKLKVNMFIILNNVSNRLRIYLIYLFYNTTTIFHSDLVQNCFALFM